MPSITYQENGTIEYFNGLRYRKVFKVNKYAKTICCSRTCGNIYRSKNK